MAVQVLGGAACLSWWVAAHGAGVINDGIAALGRSWGNLALGLAPAAAGLPGLAGRKGAGARRLRPAVTWGWVVFPPAGTVPLRLRRSPVFKRRTKHDSLPEPEGKPGPFSDAAGETRCSPPLHPC